MDFEVGTTLLLVVAGLVAGLIDSIAGGGGLVTVPSLLLAGADPIETLATNKAQSVFGSGSATVHYTRGGQVDVRTIAPMAVASAGAAAVGAIVANSVPTGWLETMIPVALVAIAIFFATAPSVADVDTHARLSRGMFALTIVPAIGFYDGMFGPGTGSFFMIAFVALRGLGVLRATGHTKVLNFASNAGALVVFALTGSVLWVTGLLMGLGQVVGASIGSHVAMRNGARVIKPLLVLVCVVMAARLLLD